jgi:hypothetical protein
LGVLTKINRAWEGFFSESDGDIGYFSDILVIRNSSRALLSLNFIKMGFETLKTLQEKLDGLDKSCGNLAKSVSWIPFSDVAILLSSLEESC